MSAWDRAWKVEDGKRRNEPPKVWEHFTHYRDLGPDRTLAKTAQHYGLWESQIRTEAAEWNWTGRCDQWDAHVRAIHDRAFLAETARKGRQRAAAWSALLGKALEALRAFDIEERRPKLGEIALALKSATEGLRLEEGLETARVTMEMQDVRVILACLPAEVRAPLVRALHEWGTAAGASDSTGERVPLGLGAGDDG